MRKTLTVTVFAAIFACSCVFGDPSPRKELRQDCKPYDAPSMYEGKMVTIRAVYGSSPFDGAYLLDKRCHVAMWFTTPAEHKTFAIISGSSYPKVKEPTFNVIEDSEYERFNRFASATGINGGPMFTVTATFVGRLDRRKNFKRGKNGWGNGFGADGASEYQFIVHSVSEVDVEQAPPFGPQPFDSTLPDRIANEK